MSQRRLPAAAASLVAAVALLAAPAGAPRAATAFPALASPSTGTHIPGKFVWFDLASSDPAAAQRFYGRVFGWTFDGLRGSPEKYAIIRNDGVPVGGVFRPQAATSVAPRARWLPFASTADIEATLAKLTAAGATVLLPATKLPGRGTHAVLRDSQGAIVGVLQSASGDRPDAAVAAGEFFWVDLLARDPAAAGRAYAKLGYDISTDEVTGGERLLLAAAGYARAGIVQLPADAREAGWLPYVQVDDVPSALARVREAGGKVLREPDPAVLNGQVAVFADPQGGVLGIIHWSTYATSAGAK